MSLRNQIDQDIKSAMKAQEKVKLLALRDIKKMILLEASKPGANGEISQDDEIKLLQKAVKQRKDSAEIYKTQNREDLLAKEEEEIAIIETYLPEALSEEELEKAVSEIIKSTGASSMADMGKVMGAATKSLAGKSDGKSISTMVKKLLG